DVKLKITDGAGREIREIAIPANVSKAGINTACWDLRVQPAPAPNPGNFPGAQGGGGGGGGRGGNQPAADPFGFGCSGGGGGFGGGGGGFGGGGGGNPGPMVLGGTYNVALVVDGKS